MNVDSNHILVIEDDDDILALVCHHLHKDGYLALGASTGEQGLDSLSKFTPQLIILDLMLPGIDGMAVCRKIRANPQHQHTPILMLTALNGEEDVVAGLEAGADDYVVKPFNNRVLLARVRSLLRRSGFVADESAADSKILTVGEISCLVDMRQVTVNAVKISLTAGEYDMLCVMMRRPGRVFTRNQLLDLVRGDNYSVTDRAIDVQIVGLRRKLGEAGRRIETVRGVGYRINGENLDSVN